LQRSSAAQRSAKEGKEKAENGEHGERESLLADEQQGQSFQSEWNF